MLRGMDASAWAAWAAAVVSVASLLATLWVRMRDRPTPDWSARRLIEPMTSQLLFMAIQKAAGGRDPRRGTLIQLVNDGDGLAYRVRPSCEQAEAFVVFTGAPGQADEWAIVQRLDRLAPGEGFSVMFWLKPGHNVENSALWIRWRRAPVRHRRDDATWFHLADPVPQARLGLRPAVRRLLGSRQRERLTTPHGE
jgi:hypothetical protein